MGLYVLDPRIVGPDLRDVKTALELNKENGGRTIRWMYIIGHFVFLVEAKHEIAEALEFLPWE